MQEMCRIQFTYASRQQEQNFQVPILLIQLKVTHKQERHRKEVPSCPLAGWCADRQTPLLCATTTKTSCCNNTTSVNKNTPLFSAAIVDTGVIVGYTNEINTVTGNPWLRNRVCYHIHRFTKRKQQISYGKREDRDLCLKAVYNIQMQSVPFVVMRL